MPTSEEHLNYLDLLSRINQNLSQLNIFSSETIALNEKISSPALSLKNVRVLEELPESGKEEELYLVPSSNPNEKDIYEEYIWVNGDFERLGTYDSASSQVIVSIPEIFGDSDIYKLPSGNSTATYTLSSSSLLKNISVLRFNVTWNGNTSQITATNDSANVEITIPSSLEENSVMNLVVSATDSLGNTSPSATKALTVKLSKVNKPSITSPSANADVYALAGITVESSAFSVNHGTDTHASTDWQICSDSNCETVVAQALASNDKTSHTFTGLDLSDNTTYYVRVRHNGTAYGASEWSDAVAVLNHYGVINVSITSPTANENVWMKTEGIVVSGGDFSSIPSDTHEESKFSISSDAGGNSVIATYTTPEGTPSDPWTTTASGRKIARHPNNKGSVIRFDMFGTTVNLFVADAQYRKNGDTKFGTYQKDSSLNNFSTYYSGTYYFYSGGDTTSGATYQAGATSGTNVGSYASLAALTDDQLQSRLSPLSTDLTARANCDVWMTYQGTTDSQSISGVPAVEWCRSLTSFDGISNGCDLPNLYELSVLYIEGDYIDALDPTLTSYPTMALGKGSNSIRWFSGHYAWSSTETSSTHVCYVFYYGRVYHYNKYTTYSVVPVRELSSFSVDGLKRHTFPASTFSSLSLNDNTSLYARLAYKGATLGYSQDAVQAFKYRLPTVNAPTILTPTANSQVVFSQGVTVTTDAFSVSHSGTDTHASTDWKITSDSAGNTVVAQATGSSDLLSHTFTGLELTGGTTYYAWAKHNGTAYSGEWSEGRAFEALAATVTASGRTIYRHSNNKGSVLVFDMFGTTVNLFVADAQYRKRADTKFGTYNKDSSLNNFSTYYSGTYYFYSGGDSSSGATYQAGATSGTNVGSYASLPPITDAQLQQRLSPLSTDLTARANCDVWMTYQGTTDSQSITGVPAVEWCRSLTSFDGISNGCDLPNLYELSVLYIEGDYIDALDPTLTSYPTMALGKGSNGSRWFNGNYAWSSTEYSSTHVCSVYYLGHVYFSYKHITRSVVPVRELGTL